MNQRRLRPRRRATLVACLAAGLVTALAGSPALAAGVPGAAVPLAPRSAPAPEVIRTSDGALRGSVQEDHRSFLGVRYAAPAERWVPATDPASWKGVRPAQEAGPECVQEEVFWRTRSAAGIDEDCLFLNVYTPAQDVKQRPVLVFFHGGGGINGAATDVQPVPITAQGDNIVVSVNYRLGVLGGLGLPELDQETADGKSGGNYANTDKVQALRWIQRNIEAFGGDPDRVAIAGQSAGAGGVCWLLASPAARGLFSAAVMQSAGSCGGASDRETAHAAGEKFAQAAGCTVPSSMLACLRRLSAAQILAVQARTGTRAGAVAGGADLPLLPSEAFSSGRFNQVPIVFGNTRNEDRAFVYEANDLLNKPVTASSYRSRITEDHGDDAAAILREYPLGDYKNPGLALAKVGTDERVCGALPVSRSMARWTPTFTYEFQDETAPLRPYMKVPSSFPIGSAHSSELPYLWQSETIGTLSERQLKLSRLMMDFWTQLARDGDPNGPALPSWPRFDAGTGHQRIAFQAGGSTKVVSGQQFSAQHHCGLWSSLA